MLRRAHIALLGVAVLGGCAKTPASGGATPDKPPPEPVVAPTDGPPAAPAVDPPPPPQKGEMAELATGELLLGSAPTTPHRNAALEADLVAVSVAAFRIDRLPYPNDPEAPIRTGATRTEAARLCSDAGKRLCTELQWERACKTDAGHAYPTGDALDAAACAAPGASCGNSLGAMSMGIAAREWTSSDWPQGFGNAMRTAVTRGAAADAALAEHRCAARSGATDDSASESIGFRCCSGGDARFSYPTEPRRKLVTPLEVELDDLRRAMSTHPELAKLAKEFKPFGRVDITRALARGKRGRGNITAWHIADSTFRWSPGPGQELWVISGSSGDRTIAAAFHVVPDGSVVHAASTVVDEADSSIAFGYTEDKPSTLLWTTCFGCPGEGGDLLVGDDGVVRFTYR